MVTYNSTKRLLRNDFSKYNDIQLLQKSKVKLLDAYRMTVQYIEFCLAKESLERGFTTIAIADKDIEGVFNNITPVDIFLGENIKHGLSVIDRRINELLQ